jgi:hypothetical protein
LILCVSEEQNKIEGFDTGDDCCGILTVSSFNRRDYNNEGDCNIKAMPLSGQARRYHHLSRWTDANVVVMCYVEGILSGTRHNDTESGANHLCLTSHPVFDGHPQPSKNGYATIYGSEYQNCPELGK